MQTLLEGGIPDAPPHWELVFQIEKTFFDMDSSAIHEATYPSEEAKSEAIWRFHFEVYQRLVEEMDWGAVPGGYDARQVRLGKSMLSDQALVAGYEGGGVFWMPNGDQIMDFAVRLFERPEELHAEARQKCEAAKKALRDMAEAGADFFVGTYDFGFNDAPFVSPEHFREFVTPYLAEIVEVAHSLGKRIILHSDGCLTKILDQIHSTGIDGYQSVDPQGHMDIQTVRATYPDWLLMGNVACNMLQEADEAKIRESVRACMTHGGIGKRYVFSTSNCIFHGMPDESYRVMWDEYRRLCQEKGRS